VPPEQHEAAQLDGAGPIRRFWHVTLPSISPVLLFGVINSIIYALQFFTQAIVAGSAAAGSADVAGNSKYIGAPLNSTLTYPVWLYVQGFRYFNMGYTRRRWRSCCSSSRPASPGCWCASCAVPSTRRRRHDRDHRDGPAPAGPGAAPGAGPAVPGTGG